MKKVGFFLSMVAVFVFGMVFVGAALAQGDDQGNVLGVTITETDLELDAGSFNLTANTPFSVVVTNTTAVTYDLVLQNRGAVNEPLMVDGREARIQGIGPNQTMSDTWVIADTGDFEVAAYQTEESAEALSATLDLGAAQAATETVEATEVATETEEADTGAAAQATETVEVEATEVATETEEVGAAAQATETVEVEATEVATETVEATEVATATVEADVEATGTVTTTGEGAGGSEEQIEPTGTAEAALPATGGTDDSMPTSIVLITLGVLFVLGGLLVGRKLARR